MLENLGIYIGIVLYLIGVIIAIVRSKKAGKELSKLTRNIIIIMGLLWLIWLLYVIFTN